jgi:hypothetical protein
MPSALPCPDLSIRRLREREWQVRWSLAACSLHCRDLGWDGNGGSSSEKRFGRDHRAELRSVQSSCEGDEVSTVTVTPKSPTIWQKRNTRAVAGGWIDRASLLVSPRGGGGRRLLVAVNSLSLSFP